jgi:hypothetical protein
MVLLYNTVLKIRPKKENRKKGGNTAKKYFPLIREGKRQKRVFIFVWKN